MKSVIKNTIITISNIRKFNRACSLIRQMKYNSNEWPLWQRGTFWIVREGEFGYDPQHSNTELEIAPGIQVYGEG